MSMQPPKLPQRRANLPTTSLICSPSITAVNKSSRKLSLIPAITPNTPSPTSLSASLSSPTAASSFLFSPPSGSLVSTNILSTSIGVSPVSSEHRTGVDLKAFVFNRSFAIDVQSKDHRDQLLLGLTKFGAIVHAKLQKNTFALITDGGSGAGVGKSPALSSSNSNVNVTSTHTQAFQTSTPLLNSSLPLFNPFLTDSQSTSLTFSSSVSTTPSSQSNASPSISISSNTTPINSVLSTSLQNSHTLTSKRGLELVKHAQASAPQAPPTSSVRLTAIDYASTWGVRIIHVNELFPVLAKLMHLSGQTRSTFPPLLENHARIVVEDIYGRYEPMTKTWTPSKEGAPTFPIFYLNAEPGMSPFVRPRRHRKRKEMKDLLELPQDLKRHKENNDNGAEARVPLKDDREQCGKDKVGNCETCHTSYMNGRAAHCMTASHLELFRQAPVWPQFRLLADDIKANRIAQEEIEKEFDRKVEPVMEAPDENRSPNKPPPTVKSSTCWRICSAPNHRPLRVLRELPASMQQLLPAWAIAGTTYEQIWGYPYPEAKPRV